jgi:hypothetical protein
MKGEKEIVPLFLLKREVSIHPRIDPDELIEWVRPRIEEAMKEGLLNG